MRNFESLGALAAHVAGMATVMREAEHAALERAARLVEKTAKAEIGNYQQEWGPFVAWAQLADSTEAAKAAKGYPADAPLLASGELRESYRHEVHGTHAIIGSTDPNAVYLELGTSKMPPRPVLGPALYRNKKQILTLIGHATTEGILYGKVTPSGDYFKL